MADEVKKFNEAEIVIGTLLFGSVDGVCILIDFTGAGLVISPILQSGAMLGASLWVWSKGNKGAFKIGKQLAKNASNFLPIIPTVATVFLLETYMHNNPKKLGVVGKVASAVSGKKV